MVGGVVDVGAALVDVAVAEGEALGLVLGNVLVGGKGVLEMGLQFLDRLFFVIKSPKSSVGGVGPQWWLVYPILVDQIASTTKDSREISTSASDGIGTHINAFLHRQPT